MAERANRSYRPDAPAHVRVSLSGDVDAAAAPDAFARLIEANPSPGDVVKLDLTDVAFIDSVGVAMLQKAQTYLDAQGCQLVLTDPSHAVVRVLTMLGLLEHFPVDVQASAATAR
jgi:anti-anti-sigma factor